MPTNLPQLDIPDERFKGMAKKCVEFGSVGNLKKLNEADVFQVLELSS